MCGPLCAKGLLMIVRRLAAAAAMLILFASPAAFAQSTPRAAPTAPDAQSAPLAQPATPVEVTSAGDTGPQVDGISIVSLFMRADPIVKSVFALLLLASLWSWAIIINKWLALGRLRRRADKFEKTFWSGLSLDELYQQFSQNADHPMAAVFVSALREWRRAFEGGPPREALLPGIKDRIDKAMSVTVMRETDGIERQLDCGDPYEGNAYTDRELSAVPTTMRDGLELFAGSPLASAALGGAVHEHLVNFARQELEAFQHECVTDWERIRYFERI